MKKESLKIEDFFDKINEKIKCFQFEKPREL